MPQPYQQLPQLLTDPPHQQNPLHQPLLHPLFHPLLPFLLLLSLLEVHRHLLLLRLLLRLLLLRPLLLHQLRHLRLDARLLPLLGKVAVFLQALLWELYSEVLPFWVTFRLVLSLT